MCDDGGDSREQVSYWPLLYIRKGGLSTAEVGQVSENAADRASPALVARQPAGPAAHRFNADLKLRANSLAVLAGSALSPMLLTPAEPTMTEQRDAILAAASASDITDFVVLAKAYAERGFWKLVSRIFPENTASIALHERCGFRIVGVYRRHGTLDGEWRDCVIVERLLGPAAET